MRNLSLALAVGCWLGLTLSFISCSGSKAKCTGCAGCCSSTGECLPGISNNNCGASGATCMACGTASACMAGVCKATATGGGSGGASGGGTGGSSSGGGTGGSGGSGGGSGAAGGGSSSGGGTATGGGTSGAGGGCITYSLADLSLGGAFDPDPFFDGTYSFTRADVKLPSMFADAGNDVLSLEEWYSPGTEPAAPATRTITMDSYNVCFDCVLVRFGVTATSGGTTLFLGRSGSLAVHAVTYANPGELRATATNLHLVEWTYNASTDAPLANGRCIDIAVASFDAGF